MNRFDIPSIDAHTHISGPGSLDFFRAYCDRQGFSAFNIASLACTDPGDAAQNLLAAAFKRLEKRVYAHASLTYPAFPVPSGEASARDFEAQAALFERMGFDGVKLLESKPTLRKKTALALDDATYEPFFARLERAGTHVIWHACDPETFWDEKLAPEFAFKEGWFYGDGTFSTKQALYDEVYAVLNRHPKLKATFAHFFFLSDDIARAERLLKTYPNVCLDITPGREMYDNFTRHYDETRDLFHRYPERIVFGTDMTDDEFQGGADELVGAMRRFLTTEDEFAYWGFPIRGIGLSREAAERVCGGNFLRGVGGAPREIDGEIYRRYAREWLPRVADEGARRFLTNAL